MKNLFVFTIFFIVLFATMFMVGCEDVAEQTTASVKFVNGTSATIYSLYISESDSTSWGSNQLNGDIISVGESFTITNIPCPEVYDFRLGHFDDSACGYSLEQRITCSDWVLDITDTTDCSYSVR